MCENTLSVRIRGGYGAFTLDVDFTIDHWPAVLFGPSGAGKSTVLRCVAGLQGAGLDGAGLARIQLNANLLTDTSKGIAHRPGTCGVQMVTQRAALFPHLTTRANIAFGLHRLPKLRQEARVDEMLGLLHAEHLADRKPTHLSGGERQRVALARALAVKPELLLLDEAFAGLDSESKQKVLTELFLIEQRVNLKILYVTHEVTDAFALQAIVFKIHNGKIVDRGPANEVLRDERQRLLKQLG